MALTNFEGAVVVITGGASGIGFATAKALRTRGAHVVLADINSLGLQQAEEQLRQQQPEATGGILAIPTDVINEEQVLELMRQASTIYGRIDLVVTCAGIGTGGPIDVFTASQMQTMMSINFMGTFLCTQAALPYMRQQGSGHFVFLSSVAGKLGVPFLSGSNHGRSSLTYRGPGSLRDSPGGCRWASRPDTCSHARNFTGFAVVQRRPRQGRATYGCGILRAYSTVIVKLTGLRKRHEIPGESEGLRLLRSR